MTRSAAIQVHRLSPQRTSTDGSIRSCFQFIEPFIKNPAKNHIHLLYCSQVDITDDTIENAIEVFEALITSVEEVECSDAVYI